MAVPRQKQRRPRGMCAWLDPCWISLLWSKALVHTWIHVQVHAVPFTLMMRALQALTVHATPWQQLSACCIAARARCGMSGLKLSSNTPAPSEPPAL